MTTKKALEQLLSRVTKLEGGKYQARYADIKEAIKILNKELHGALYPMIKAVEEAKQ